MTVRSEKELRSQLEAYNLKLDDIENQIEEIDDATEKKREDINGVTLEVPDEESSAALRGRKIDLEEEKRETLVKATFLEWILCQREAPDRIDYDRVAEKGLNTDFPERVENDEHSDKGYRTEATVELTQITSCGEGIGKELAHIIAERHLKVVCESVKSNAATITTGEIETEVIDRSKCDHNWTTSEKEIFDRGLDFRIECSKCGLAYPDSYDIPPR